MCLKWLSNLKETFLTLWGKPRTQEIPQRLKSYVKVSKENINAEDDLFESENMSMISEQSFDVVNYIKTEH